MSMFPTCMTYLIVRRVVSALLGDVDGPVGVTAEKVFVDVDQ